MQNKCNRSLCLVSYSSFFIQNGNPDRDKPPCNSQELEDCDGFPEDSSSLTHFDGDSLKPTQVVSNTPLLHWQTLWFSGPSRRIPGIEHLCGHLFPLKDTAGYAVRVFIQLRPQLSNLFCYCHLTRELSKGSGRGGTGRPSSCLVY